MTDYHHIANPLFYKAINLQKKGDEQCVDLFLTAFKGFYLSAFSIGGLERLRIEGPLFSKLIKDEFRPKVIDGLTDDLKIKGAINSSNSFYDLSQKIGQQSVDDLFINIKADRGLLDYLLGIEFEHKGMKMNYDDKNFTLKFNNKDSANYFLNAVSYYKKALNSPNDMPEELIRVKRKRAFDKFSIYGIKERIEECTKHYFQLTSESVRELTDNELNTNTISVRQLWKSI
ncbi:MAG: hypothetical protein WC307_00280 [Candidatus Nanoarchaeia archaeon]|jgi:hypothetical protein